MTRPAQKELERRQLALAMRVCPDLLPIDIDIRNGNEKNEPDFIVRLASGRSIGIELTSLRDRQEVDGYVPSQLEAARDRIVFRAIELYQAAGGRPVCVNAYIDEGPYEVESVAQYLAAMVLNHAADGICVSAWPACGAPASIHISVWPCGEHERLWRLSAVGETKCLTQQVIQDAVEIKERKVSRNPYESGLDELWLLVVATMFPSSSDFVFPSDTAEWSIVHSSFHRVLVLSQGDWKLLSF
ncbi:MAG: hypothetical protein ACOY82_12960 [Pseudomonadota bacterium]